MGIRRPAGGQRVRFGNGKDVADGADINFQDDAGDYPYLAVGAYRKGTTPVGSFAPNSLGLFDMSVNAWEWTLDGSDYSDESQANPCRVTGVHMLRGRRWGGVASEIRVFRRSAWPQMIGATILVSESQNPGEELFVQMFRLASSTENRNLGIEAFIIYEKHGLD